MEEKENWNILEQFEHKDYSYTNYDNAIKIVMEECNLSKSQAFSALLLYMCEHGSIEDFKECINYIIENNKDD